MTTLASPGTGTGSRRLRVPNWVPGTVGLAIFLLLWWSAGAFGNIGTAAGGSSAIPTPFAVIEQMVEDGFTFYWRNASVTLTSAGTGFLIGNLLAVLTASLVLIAPWLESIATQLAVITYCLPLIAIGPVVYAVGGQPMTANVLAGLSVYFVTVVTTIQGLKSADKAGLDVITVAGGNRLDQLRKVQLIGAVPYVFTALKIAAPASVLGAILGEYVGGITRGLGPAMVAAQGNNVERLWALAIVGVIVAGLAYAVIAVIGRYATPWTRK